MAARDGAAPSRFVTAGGGTLAVAGLAAVLTMFAREFTVADWIVTASAAVTIAFVAINALPIRGLRMKRNGLNAEAVFLDLSVVTPLYALGGMIGGTAVVTALATGYTVAALIGRSKAPTDLLRHGVMRTLTALAFLPFVENFAQTPVHSLSAILGAVAFAGVVAGVNVVFLLGISAPLSAFTYHISLSRVWARVLGDPRTWIVAAGNVVWATVVRDPLLGGHFVLAIAMWLPVVGGGFTAQDDRRAARGAASASSGARRGSGHARRSRSVAADQCDSRDAAGSGIRRNRYGARRDRSKNRHDGARSRRLVRR